MNKLTKKDLDITQRIIDALQNEVEAIKDSEPVDVPEGVALIKRDAERGKPRAMKALAQIQEVLKLNI